MNKQKRNYVSALFAAPLLTLLPLPALAQVVVSDTLTGASSSYPWTTNGGACLTAGTAVSTLTSTIPACNGLPYYSSEVQVGGVSGRLPDPVGSGALRLTNGDTTTGTNGNGNAGSVVSKTPFSTSQGVQVTFTTTTYGGNAFGNGNGVPSGADGLVFFLKDGTKTNPTIGSIGGSLGYSCSQNNSPPAGVEGGYLAVAADEYGNFSNRGDSTATGIGPNPNTIVVRGSGDIRWSSLNAQYPSYYPSSLSVAAQDQAVRDTCRLGTLQNWASGQTITTTDNKGRQVVTPVTSTDTGTKIRDYDLISLSPPLPVPIFNQEAVNMPTRGAAVPITYDLKITQDGLLNFAYSINGGAFQNVVTNQSITASNGPLPSSFLFGFSSGTGGGSNVHEILCFKAAPLNQSASSAGTNVQQSAKVQAGSQVYLAYYHPQNSWGEMTASTLVADATGAVTINSTANWDANCVLTGGTCTATGTTTTAQAPTARNVLSWNDATKAGVPFQYTNLSVTQQTALGGSTDGTSRISFLRGDRTNELTAPGVGVFRHRDGVLGDVRNSSPTWVGFPSQGYSSAGKDKLTNTTIAEFGASYASFVSSNATRPNIVYVGANDGMMHGFRAGAYDSSTHNFTTATTPNDGKELLSYVPSGVVSSIHPAAMVPNATALDFSSPQYSHNEYVDATPGDGDLYYNGAWHTWLVGGLGAGGNSTGAVNDNMSTTNGVFYALDITDPTTFAEGNAAAIVKGEWNSSTITCSNVMACGTNFGSIFGTPIIRRMHDGNWAVIFGNGRNSATGTAGIFIMTVDRATGTPTFRFLDTGVKSATAKNGVDYVSSADLDGDRVVDYLYAGDLNGNVWRFDVTDASPANWKADTSPMFTTAAGQPITTRLAVNAITQASGPSRLVIALGTGKQTPQTLTSPAVYATGTQSLYGVWDSKMTAWNAKGSTQFTALTTPPTTIALSTLQTQSITTYASASGNISGYRTVTQNKVCWSGSTVCTGGATSNTQFGWKVDLPSSTEQVIYNPLVAYGTFLINTTIPSTTQALSCAIQPASGFTMALSPETGGATAAPFFDSASTDAGFPASNTTNGFIGGLGLSATGSPSIVTASGKPFLVQQTTKGTGVVTKIDPVAGSSGRLTWIKLR